MEQKAIVAGGYQKRNWVHGFIHANRYLVVEIISALLILLFLYTGLSKLFEHEKFVYNLKESPLLSSIAGILSWALPIGEVIIAGLLLFRRTQLKGLWLSFGMLLAFTIYLIYMVSFHDKLPCSCGGVISEMTWRQHIFFNLFFAGLSFGAIRLRR